MDIAEIPQQVSSTVQHATRGLRRHSQGLLDQHWTRTVAVGSLVAGAVLLASGKRKAGLAVSAAGAVVALLEDPKEMVSAWKSIPHYLQTGQRLLGDVERFVGDLASQGNRIRSLIVGD